MAKISRIESKMPVKERWQKVAAYARVSMETARPAHSLSVQVSFYSRLIQNNPEWDYAGVYADFGISGTKTAGREGFHRLITDCEAGKIDIVLTKSISRFARNTVDLLATVRHLKEIGVEVWFEKEQIHSLSESGEMMLTMLASFAQEESRSISENIKWAVRKGFEKGKQNGRRRMYGYQWNGEICTIVPEEAEIIRLMFCNYISGISLKSTAEQLKEMGVKTLRGHDFTSTQISYILQNEWYCGDKLLQKWFVEDNISHKEKRNQGELPMYYVRDCHEAIVDRNTFRQVQKEIRHRCIAGQTAQPGRKTYCFTGKIICGTCGHAYIRAKNNYKAKEPYVYWRCKTKKIKGVSCSSKNIPEKALRACIAKVLGTAEFDETVFMEQIEKIVIDGQQDILLHFYNGRTIWAQIRKYPERYIQKHKTG